MKLRVASHLRSWSLRLVGTSLGALAAIAPLSAGAQSPPVDGYQITRVGLFGPGYEYFSGGVRNYSAVKELNEAGQVIGTTSRLSSTGGFLGTEGWLYNGASTQVLGLTGGVYEYTGPAGVVRGAPVNDLNNAGHVAGESRRYSGPGDSFGSLGRDAWLYDGITTQRIGYIGGVYERPATGGVHRDSSAFFLNESGEATGISTRFNSLGDTTGYDAWLTDGATTTQIGLIGNGYEYNSPNGLVRLSRPHGLNDAGQAVGASTRISSAGVGLGTDAWFFNGVSSQAIGLSGSGYDVIDPAGVAHESQPQLVNAAGKAVGYSFRFSSSADFLGSDVWLFNGASTQLLGPTGGIYDYNSPAGVYRAARVAALSDSGIVAGQTARILSETETYGQDAWIVNGATTQILGLTGPGYQYNVNGQVFRSSLILSSLALNEAGQLAGVSQRFDAAGGQYGETGWFYDLASGVTTPLEFSVRGDNYSSTEPQIVTEDGVVLGSYELYAGNTYVGHRLFWWSLADGLHDLGELVDGGLDDAGWQSLAEVNWATGTTPSGAPRYLVGTGVVEGQTEGKSVYLLTAPSAGELAGDFDDDGEVDGADLTQWRGDFGVNGESDADDDGDGDGADFLAWQRQLGSPVAAAVRAGAVGAAAVVPEPATLCLAMLTLVAATLRARVGALESPAIVAGRRVRASFSCLRHADRGIL